MPIERATSLTQVIQRSALLVGAPLAGLLISIMGTAAVLWLDAASFFVSAAVIGLTIAAPQPAAGAKSSSYFGEMREGFRFILQDRLILAIVATVMLTNFLDVTFSGVVRPVYVKQAFGEALNLGLLIGVNGGGGVIGGLIFAAIGHRLPRHAIFVAAFMLAGMQFWIYALQPSFTALLAATLITSIGAGPLNPIIGAVLFERVPADMRGRVFGPVTAGAWMAMPIGMLLGGVLTESFGVFPVLIGLGVAYFLATSSMALIPVMKEMNRKAAAPLPETAQV